MTWSNPVPVVNGGWFHGIAASGKYVHIVSGEGNLYHRRSIDEGATFSEFKLIGRGTAYLEDPITAEGERVAIVAVDTTRWIKDFASDRKVGDLLFISSTNGGRDFGIQRQITSGANALRVSLAENGDDLHLVWMDWDDTAKVWNIKYMRSLDFGLSWSIPVVLRRGKVLTAGPMRPVVAAVANYVHIAWMDDSDMRPPCTIEGGTRLVACTEIYSVRSSNRGQSFESSVRRTNSPLYAGRPDIAAYGAGVAISHDLGSPNQIAATTSSDFGQSFGIGALLSSGPSLSTHSVISGRAEGFTCAWNTTENGVAHNYARSLISGRWGAVEKVSVGPCGIPLIAESQNYTHLLFSDLATGRMVHRRKAAQAVVVPVPPPPAPEPTPAPTPPPPTGGTVLTADEIKTLRDLNYIARKAYNTDGTALWDRFIVMSEALRDGTHKSWADSNRSQLLGMMAATPDGLYGPNRSIIDKLAAELGIPVASVPAPGTGPAPEPPPAPPVSGDLRAQLEAVGVEFNTIGTISGVKVASYGAPEGPYFGYFGAADAGLRIFAGIREMIGGKWMNRQVEQNTNLPRIMGPVVERDGAISWDWNPPIFGSDPNPNPFKTFLIYLGGFVRGVGPRSGNAGPYIDIGTFEAGRGLRLNVRRAGSTTPDFDCVFQLDPDGTPALRLGGQLRKVTLDADGRLIAGEVVDENQ